MSASSKINLMIKEGNSYRIIDFKKLKKETDSSSSIFSKQLIKVIKNMISMEKDLPLFQELAEKHGIKFEDLKDLLSYLYERECISFIELLPLAEDDLDFERGKKILERLSNLGLMSKSELNESLDMLKRAMPYLKNADNTLEYIAEQLKVKPIKLKTLFKRF
ncbi:MAG: hypothetical protein ACXQS8_08270, partial [Candidatus Helarchaeales archaeon]